MDATFWALIALFIFLGVVVYLKVPGMIAKALDERAAKIRDELDEARRLREEAQQLLAEFQKKRKEAEKEAADIVAAAKREADALLEEAHKKTRGICRRAAPRLPSRRSARPSARRSTKCARSLSMSPSRRRARCSPASSTQGQRRAVQGIR